MKQIGLYEKYAVTRVDGKSDDRVIGFDDRGSGSPLTIKADYFVLKLNSGNKYEIDALEAFAKSCKDDLPLLSADLFEKVIKLKSSIKLK